MDKVLKLSNSEYIFSFNFQTKKPLLLEECVSCFFKIMHLKQCLGVKLGH
jgi:hypothetical protein